jgi:cell division septation protein DedD
MTPAVWEESLEAMDAVEAHWGAGTILTLFFATTLVSAVFFGLGYSFGRGGTAKPVGSMLTSGSASVAVPESKSPVSSTKPERHLPAAATTALRKDMPAPVTHKPSVAAIAKAASTTHYMVQVGAIGNRKDAQRLVTELRRKGFHAAIHPGAHDKFLHVQIGPFASEAQAQTMRHKVAASGFHAILKHA